MARLQRFHPEQRRQEEVRLRYRRRRGEVPDPEHLVWCRTPTTTTRTQLSRPCDARHRTGDQSVRSRAQHEHDDPSQRSRFPLAQPARNAELPLLIGRGGAERLRPFRLKRRAAMLYGAAVSLIISRACSACPIGSHPLIPHAEPIDPTAISRRSGMQKRGVEVPPIAAHGGICLTPGEVAHTPLTGGAGPVRRASRVRHYYRRG